MVKLSHIDKKFGKVEVLRGIDLEIGYPGVLAILGPNGSGKTTLIKLILGMVIPDKGEVYIDGKKVLKDPDYRRNIGYLPQIARFPDNITVNEVIDMIKDLRQMPSDEDRLIELFKLEPYLDKKLGHLSGGTRQKVNIVLTFMFDSPILILDEPTAGLDPRSMIVLKDIIAEAKANGKTVLMTTHIMSLVEEIADEVIFLLDGKIRFRGEVELLKNDVNKDKLDEAIAVLLEKEYV